MRITPSAAPASRSGMVMRVPTASFTAARISAPSTTPMARNTPKKSSELRAPMAASGVSVVSAVGPKTLLPMSGAT
jgi:hypothetical protein